MKITRAQHYGMCFGVRDAISLAKAQTQDEPLTILGDLVHNEQVMADLKNRGVTIEKDVNEIRTKKSDDYGSRGFEEADKRGGVQRVSGD